ncbi:hypothetical protein ACGF1Z_22610 [Streptomyces sp. NPDC048018]|uniref:hypothetical protein n=1 Tax=Streptomyces sp. NPDC048018 TaxID=3365499 RepID=UPI0037169678
MIYEITKDGVLKSYKDNSATGGSLLTPVKTYGSGWGAYKRVWANGGASSGIGAGRIFAQSEDGSITIFVQSEPSTGNGTMTPYSSKLSGSGSAASAIAVADDVWAIGSTVYTLTSGEVKYWPYKESVAVSANGKVTVPSLGDFGSVVNPTNVVASGIAQTKRMWSPGPGVFYAQSVTGVASSEGTVRSYGGNPVVETNSEVGVGLRGSFLVDQAECLSPSLDEKPRLGNELELPPIAPPAQPTDEVPSERPDEIAGRFTLGNGMPVAGLTVRLEPSDSSLLNEDGSPTKLAPLGTVTTAADGTWSFKLPDQLPADVQKVVDANSGALNVSVTTFGTTTSGVEMVGVDQVTAAPTPSPAGRDTSGGARTALATSAASEPTHTVALIPAASPTSEMPEPTAAQQRATFAAQFEASPTAGADDAERIPLWQNDKGAPPGPGYNPYLVNGKDVSSEAVADSGAAAQSGALDPRASGSCYNVTTRVSNAIAYTTVGEAHAYYDAKASFEYKSKLSTSVDVAVSTGSNWKMSGTATLGSSASSSAGFANQGPYFGKHWRVPINYEKQKITYYCGAIPRSAYYRVIATGYRVPAGGRVGSYGKSVVHLDGPLRFGASNPARRAELVKGGTYSLNVGRSVKWGGAVSVMGLSLSASTQYDREHEQKIAAGNKSGRHWIWGVNAPIGQREGTFYSN